MVTTISRPQKDRAVPGVGNMVSVVQVAEPRSAVAAAPSVLQGNLRPDPSPLALGPVISPFQRVWELPVHF